MNRYVVSLISALLLSSCGNVKDQLGISKDAPDEFAVVRHAPLEMPQAIILPPPRPGMPRPQEQTPTAQAKSVIFGQTASSTTRQTASGAEAVLLQKTGAAQSDPSIRQTLEIETEEAEKKNRPVIDRLLGKVGHKKVNTAETLDPKTESQRLKQNNLPTTELPPDLQKQEDENKE